MRISDFFCGPVLCVFWLPVGADLAPLSAPDEVTAALGGSLTVSCHYADIFRDQAKYWCRGEAFKQCHILVTTWGIPPSSRALIADYKQRGFFTVTMTSLEERDEGKYWCAIATRLRSVHRGVRVRISHAGTTDSTTTSVTQDDTCGWWTILRWILFILLLSCLISTHIFARRIAP